MKDFAAIGIDLPPLGHRMPIMAYLNQTLQTINDNPQAEILIFMSAYDEDPRELYEIPEARDSWLKAARWLEEHLENDARIDAESKSVLAIMRAIEHGQPVACDLENRSRLFVLDA